MDSITCGVAILKAMNASGGMKYTTPEGVWAFLGGKYGIFPGGKKKLL